MDASLLVGWTGFDALLVLVFVLGLWAGWHRGVFGGAAALAALIASLGLAWVVGPVVAAWTQREGWTLGVWALPAGVLLVYVAARLLFGALLGQALSALPAAAHRHVGNRVLGVLPGAVNGLINAVLLVLLWQALPLPDAMAGSARDSRIAGALAPPADWLHDRLAAVFEPAWQEAMRRTTVQPGTRKLLELPFTVADAPARPAMEAQLLALVNQARVEQGLRPLAADPEATQVARAHSRDMFARGYFSHVSLQGQDPFDRMRAAGVRFRAAGENLALSPTVAVAHRGLMNSPGHRANILRPAFGRVGIGIVDGGRRGLMVTQVFRD